MGEQERDRTKKGSPYPVLPAGHRETKLIEQRTKVNQVFEKSRKEEKKEAQLLCRKPGKT
jgi:hypothetical protein